MEILAQVLRVDADMRLCLWSSIINIDPDSSWVLYRCGDVSVLQMTFSPTPIQTPKTLGSCALPTCSSRPLTNQVWTLLPQATGDQEIWGLWTCLLECKSSFTCKFKKKKKKILLQCAIPIAAESVNGSALLLLALQLLPLHDGRPVCFVFLLKR